MRHPSYQADMRSSLVGRLLLRAFHLRHLPHLANTSLLLERTARGRPVVAGRAALAPDANVSHSGDWVVLAGGLGRVGVDVMRTRDSRVDRLDRFFSLMRGQFTEGEWRSIRGEQGEGERSKEKQQKQLERFFRHWTLKESFVKAVGTGLNLDLQTLDFRVGSAEVAAGRVEEGTVLVREGAATAWRFQESRIDSEHLASVCLEEGEEKKEEGREVERFTDLTVGEVLAMFPTSPSAVFRPPNPADFELYDRKLRTKPF